LLLNYKHGDTRVNDRSRLYRIWTNIKSRCYNKNVDAYKNYGGRGIKLCDEWKNYIVFRKWSIENGYNDDLTIDRINNDGDYCPFNCRWVSRKIQSNNTRSNTLITVCGETHNISEWSRIKNIKPATIINRIKRGWSIEDAIQKSVKRDTNHEFYQKKMLAGNPGRKG